MPLPTQLPLSEQRDRVAQYLHGIGLAFRSVAGSIIEERLPIQCARDPIRPSLVLWACAANGGDLADALPVGAALALFDRFMVLHDELSDGAAPTVARWGLGQTLNAGDAFYALGFRALTSDVRNAQRRLEAARVIGQAVLAAIERRGGLDGRDTLTGAALEAGAIVSGAPANVTRAFARAGRLVGAAAVTDDAARAQRIAAQAVTALRRHVREPHWREFEQIAYVVARRAA